MSVAVAGLGQPAAGDDGVGCAVIEALRADPPPGADLLALRDAAPLVDLLGEGRPLVLVDAVVDGEPEGAVRELAPGDLADAQRTLSSHGLSASAALSLAQALWGALPPLRIVAVSIALPGPLRVGLSPAVAAAVPAAASRVRALIEELSDA